jgi:hypothetical protein
VCALLLFSRKLPLKCKAYIGHPGSRLHTNGRFTKGCQPGPGRPRKLVRKFVPPSQLLQRGLDMDDSSTTWKLIVDRFGPVATRKLLENIEAEYGPICFRHVALQAIAAGHQKAIEEQHSPQRISPKNASKHKPSKRSAHKQTRITQLSGRSLPTPSKLP